MDERVSSQKIEFCPCIATGVVFFLKIVIGLISNGSICIQGAGVVHNPFPIFLFGLSVFPLCPRVEIF